MDRWSVRFLGSLATIAIGVPAVTFGSLAYWDELTQSDVALATTCAPERSGIVDNGTRYVVEKFTTVGTCTWTVPTGVTEADVLVVGGGGGGGSAWDNAPGGGGGAGGLLQSTTTVTPGAGVTVTTGSGGAGGLGDAVQGADGGNSSFGSITALGGGGGGSARGNGRPGGSGGGAGGRTLTGASRTGGSGTGGQGNDGGASVDRDGGVTGGGGGGASGAGVAGVATSASARAAGGAGTSSSITGTSVTYATGGASGLNGVIEVGANATLIGSGGGGASDTSDNTTAGGTGSDGIVVVRYEVPGSDADHAWTAEFTYGTTSSYDYLQASGSVITYDSDGTIEAWVYFDPDEGIQYGLWGTTANLYLGTWGLARTVGSRVLDYPIRVGDSWDTSIPMPQERWVHIAVTWSGLSALIYLDGTLAESTSSFIAPSASTSGASPFRIGTIYDNPSTPSVPWPTFWEGMIDEVRVWNDVRTPAEIAAGMHTAVSTADANLAAYWDFNQSSGSTVTAIGAAGATATLTTVGSPSFTELGAADTASRPGWTVHEFERSYITAAGGWTVPSNVIAAEVLIVGGGGGGGAWVGGGGGGGGVSAGYAALSPGATQTVRVGQSGLGSRMRGVDTSSGADDFLEGSDGGESAFGGTSVLGGGLGATWDVVASSGAATKATGGGGALTSGTGSAGTGTTSNGGAPQSNAQPHLAGGGGGAGGNGIAGGTVANRAGNGGPGLASSITGSSIRYGGGGGGSAHGSYSSPTVCTDCSNVVSGQGVDGGGSGAVPVNSSAIRVGGNGTPNRGGGGGGSANYWDPSHPFPSLGGSGGSGIVVLAYPDCTASSVQAVTIGGIEYRYQRFTTPDTDSADGTHNGDLACADSWTVPSGVTSVDVLIAAGGGGGGANPADLITGGGGGAGGLILDTVATTPGAALGVTVGSGGDGAISGTDNAGDHGSNTVFGSLTAIGGGGGGSRGHSGTSGGSGGGNGYPDATAVTVGAGTAGQGSNGVYHAAGNTGGAGGGASGSGQAGITSSITGTVTGYATGGGPAIGQSWSAPATAGSGNGGNAGYDYAVGIDNGIAGSSGTVIIRWVADPADALPVIDLYARYRAGDYDRTTKIWADSSGNGRHTGLITGAPTVTTNTGNGATGTFPVVSGTTSDVVEFPTGVLPSNYTFHFVARYSGAAQGRIFTEVSLTPTARCGSNGNWLTGFYYGNSPAAYRSWSGGAGWLTSVGGPTQDLHGDDWVLGSDQIGGLRTQGADRTVVPYTGTATCEQLSINGRVAETSDWQVADILVFGRQLGTTELRSMENHLGRAYGMALPGLQTSGVTAATVLGQTDRLTVSWTAPSDPGLTPTSYIIEQSSDGGTTWTTATTSGTVAAAGTTVTGLTGGTDYEFRITAELANITNEFPSPASTAVAPLVASTTALTWSPSSPTDSQTITLTATVTDGANPIAGASVAFDDGSATITGCSAATTDSAGEATCTWGPVADAAYSVTATATGSSIVSSFDTETITVTPSAPGQPTGLTATPNGAGQVDLSWTAPASGSAPTDYRVQYRVSGSDPWFTWARTTTPLTSRTESVTGLGSGQTYEFRVTALANSVAGTPSAPATATTAVVYALREFTTTGTTAWRVPTGVTAVDVLVVGGGGGGGGTGTRGFSGGGGAGGQVTERIAHAVTAGSDITVTVGAGGTGGSSTSNVDTPTEGDDSSFGALTAAGGGRGGHALINNVSNYAEPETQPSGGARNGGGGAAQGGRHLGASSNSGSRSGGDGFGSGTADLQAGGGGGGAGTAGGAATSGQGGAGGSGATSTITGLTYGGGGGGGKRTSTGAAGTGGTGGGGAGGKEAAGGAGVDGRGGGGGGGGGQSPQGAGGAGGDGIVVVRHAPAATSRPDLTDASDTGASNTDDRTGDTTPTFTGTAQHGSTVQLYADDGTGPVATGSTCTADASTMIWSCTTAALTDDDYEITAVATFAVDGVTLNEMSSSLTITIDTALTINAITLPGATVGNAYSATLTASGGITPLTWAITSGALPAGLSLGSTNGIISGTPTAAGPSSFTVTVTDANNPPVSDSLAKTLTVALASQTITFADPADRAWSATPFSIAPSTSATGLTVTVASSTTNVCTVSGLDVTMLRTGTCTLTASQTGNSTYAAATAVTHSFEISGADQTITFANPGTRAWSGTAFSVSASTDSGLGVTLTSSTTAVCTVSAFTVTMVRSGTCTLVASQAGDTQYAAAPEVARSFTISAAAQTITFAPSFPATTYGDDPFSIAGTASSDLVLAYTTSTPAVCSVIGDASVTNGNATNAVVTPIGAGTCEITAAQAGDTRYAAATSVSRSFTIAQAAQAPLVFTSASSGVWGDTFTAAVSGGSGTGALAFGATAGTAGCTIDASSGAVTYTSAGTCTITADRAGDTNHLAATQVSQTLTIATAAQTLTFTSTVPASPRPGGTYTLTATTTSGLTPVFTITAGQTTVCTLSGGVVTFLTTGMCTITAAQPGDSRFAAATAQTQTITVGSLNQSITVTVPADVDYGTPGVALDAEASSDLTVTVTSADTDVCTVTGLVITPVDIGDCDLTLTQTGDNRYAAASPVTISFRVVPARPTAPTIVSVSAGNANATVGFTAPGFTGGVALGAYTITATPTSGTAITDTNCTASPCTITGLTNGTDYTLTVTANNTAGAGPASTASPAVTPATRATAVTTLAATPGNGTLRVTWGAPADFGGGTFTRYELRIAADGTAMPAAATAAVTSSTAGSYTFTGLDNGTAYNVEIVTITSANQTALTGNTATLSSVPVSTPTEPTDLTVNVISPRVVRLAWAEPARDGGAPVTGYTVTITATGGTTVDCGTITIAAGTRTADCTSDLLELSTTYTITVAAVNRIGTGPAATATHTTPTFTAPTTPPVTTTSGDTDACPCVYDANGNPVPVDIERTPAGRTPGEITIDVTPSTISLGGGTGSASTGQATTWIDANGRFTAQTPGTIPFNGAGALPGTTVTIFINGTPAGTATVTADGTWTLNLTLPAGTNGPIDITIVWIDTTGTQRTLTTPITIIATGEAATAPRTPAGGTQLTPDPDTVIAIGPNGERLDATRATDPATDTITITVGDTTLRVTPAENGRLDATGRLVLTHPARVRVTGEGMLPGATATVWIMSNPQRLGTVTVATDGTIDTTYAIPTGIEAGNHTIQIDTADADGQPLSIALGLIITTGLLPSTGADTDTHLAWLTLMLALGALTSITANGTRRRRV